MANYTPALKNGKLQEVNDKEVEYEFVSPNDFFGDNINLMPMMGAVPPQRNFYSAKFHSQTVPLKNPEAPLVQTLKDADKQISYEDYIGKKMGTVYADPEDGDVEILKITPDQITYKTANGLTKSKDLYNNFNFNRKTSITNTPVVKKGDIVKAGSLLAKSNFTDDKGTMAFGVNAYTAIIPYKGWTMDDAVVISEDFAKKLTSQHSYKFQETDDKTRKTNKAHFSSLFPKAFTKDQLDNIDDNGVVKVGTIVKEGDPLILSTTPRMVSSKESQLGKLSKYLRNTRTDASVKWDHQDDGIVTDVVKSKNGWKVNVQSYAIARPADKITQRSGNKGLISKIIPQELMPRDSEGTPFDVLFNPLGLVSRVNANLVYETLLGKVAKKTGKVYKLPAFNNQDESWYNFVKSELDKNGISDKDRVYDPEDDRWIEKPVTTGYLYIQKLHHTGESKLSARGQGLYSLEGVPLKGGDEGTFSKRLSGLESTSLLSAGAYDVIKDASTLRGQQNDEYWRKVRSGELPSLAKKSPFVWDKFIAILQGTGINPVKKGHNGEIIRLSPFTDRQLEQTFKPVEIKNGEILDFRTLQPVEGGLFDPAMGVTSKWGKITLSEPVINPAFENTVAALLGVKKSDLYSIISGEKDLENYGTGSIAIQKALKDIDIKKMFNESAKTFKSGPKTHKQKALNRMNYIKGLVRNEISPEELMITKVPVLPQAFRPYSIMGDTFIPGDVNELYKEVFNVNQAHKELKDEIGEEEARSNSMNLYNAVKALYGIEGSNNRKLQQRGVSGFMDKLVGGTAKFSYAQSKLWSKPVDFSGRAAINPNPELSMDEVGIPYDIAWKIYSPWIQRELSKRGMPLAESVKAIEERTPEAKQALEQVVKEKAVIYSRAPSWHKFGLLGGFAKLHNGKNILINPLTASGLGADYDGDCQIGNIFIALPRN